jgi:hypothetical protein
VTVIPLEPGEPWKPGRGDYGCEYAGNLIEIVEQHNCVKGCTKAGTPEQVAEHGPGGVCDVLVRIFTEEPVPELDPRPDGPVCTVREDPATVGMDPLFDAPAGVS